MKAIPVINTLLVLIFLIACQTNKSEQDIFSIASDSTSVAGFTGDSIKLIKTASILLKVKDANQSTLAVFQLTQQLGGLISHQTLESNEGQTQELKISDDSILAISSYTPSAEITIRVPAQNLEELMRGLAGLGYFTSSSKMDLTDKSLDYLATHLKQQNRTKALTLVNKKNPKDSARARLIITNDEIIEQEIAKRQINADVSYSTIQLRLHQNTLVKKEVIANYFITDYRLGFGKSVVNALSEGWEYFLGFIIILTHLWMFIIVAIIILIIFRYYRYKRKLVN
ncbi:MAG: DUF4349 domain-containing protein [Chitinophagaceae bacterium]